MFFNYIWQSSGFTRRDAHDRFSSVLQKQRELYGSAFGLEPAVKTKQIGNILLGQLRYEAGVVGWEPWIDAGDAGIAWGGICEDYLGGKLDAARIDEIRQLLANDPGKLLAWDGMFSVALWDEKEGKVFLATAATECPTLWHTEGPCGWASGPRASPLLELVGRKAEPDMDAMRLYLLFGYFIGGHSPFRHVSRVRDRQLITIGQDAAPVFNTYASLREYLGCGLKNADWRQTVGFAANRLIERVNTQIKHSLEPVVLLTGGRDSRSIAAAAKKTGHDFTAATGGPADSQDVVIAARVAKLLDIKHRLTGDAAPPELLRRSIERIRTWTQMTEGIIPIDYSLHMKDFFEAKLPFPAERAQYLHGLEPGIGRGSFYPHYPDVDVADISAMTLSDVHSFVTNTNKNHYLKSSKAADDLLEDIYLRLDSDIQETGGNTHHWFELLLWRERGLIWGMDLESIKNPVRWAWMPLFDRELMALSWNLTIDQKIEARLLLDASAAMVADLADMPCTQYTGGRRTGLAGRIKNRIRSGMRHYSRRIGGTSCRNEGAPDQPGFWEAGLLNNGGHIWDEFIDGKDLQKIIRISPHNALLWRLTTVNFLAEAFF
ncbi:MAG: asparagine synthase-related protein [Nitrospiraceae bacterium]|nr:asparagine synthase-related protein [Nitrospiraceae bacterium]